MDEAVLPDQTEGQTSEQEASRVADTERPKAPRSRRWRRWLAGTVGKSRLRRAAAYTTVGGFVALVVVWWAVHTFDWAGPLVANSLRAIIGVDNVAKLEDFVYAI